MWLERMGWIKKKCISIFYIANLIIFNILSSSIPTSFYTDFPLFVTILQVVFINCRFFHCIPRLKTCSFQSILDFEKQKVTQRVGRSGWQKKVRWVGRILQGRNYMFNQKHFGRQFCVPMHCLCEGSINAFSTCWAFFFMSSWRLVKSSL